VISQTGDCPVGAGTIGRALINTVRVAVRELHVVVVFVAVTATVPVPAAPQYTFTVELAVPVGVPTPPCTTQAYVSPAWAVTEYVALESVQTVNVPVITGVGGKAMILKVVVLDDVQPVAFETKAVTV
jgi:hypothetical protein